MADEHVLEERIHTLEDSVRQLQQDMNRVLSNALAQQRRPYQETRGGPWRPRYNSDWHYSSRRSEYTPRRNTEQSQSNTGPS